MKARWHLPGEPVFDWAELDAYMAEHGHPRGTRGTSSDSYPRALGFDTKERQRRYFRSRSRGVLGLGEADSIALHLGVHPCVIWPDWLDIEEAA